MYVVKKLTWMNESNKEVRSFEYFCFKLPARSGADVWSIRGWRSCWSMDPMGVRWWRRWRSQDDWCGDKTHSGARMATVLITCLAVLGLLPLTCFSLAPMSLSLMLLSIQFIDNLQFYICLFILSHLYYFFYKWLKEANIPSSSYFPHYNPVR